LKSGESWLDESCPVTVCRPRLYALNLSFLALASTHAYKGPADKESKRYQGWAKQCNALTVKHHMVTEGSTMRSLVVVNRKRNVQWAFTRGLDFSPAVMPW
jgi:hypothetical protein